MHWVRVTMAAFIASLPWIVFLYYMGAVRPMIEDDVSNDADDDNREPGAEQTQ